VRILSRAKTESAAHCQVPTPHTAPQRLEAATEESRCVSPAHAAHVETIQGSPRLVAQKQQISRIVGPSNHGLANRAPQIPLRNANTNSIIQLKPAEWALSVVIRKLTGDIQKGTHTIIYDDEVGVTVGEIKAQLCGRYGGLYAMKLVFLGTNAQLNNDLANDGFMLRPDRIRAIKANLMAGLQEKVSEEEVVAAEAPKSRPENVITQRELREIIERYGFVKIVTGNHIHSAKSVEEGVSSGVKSQQIDEVNGNTLFIDPLFQPPGSEGQYHDILCKQGARCGALGHNLYFAEMSDGILLGILACHLYTDEVDELGVTVKHYIHETRPVNVIKE